MHIIVPMAGRGSRFSAVSDTNPEYKKPKPLILVKGKPMVWWALASLPYTGLNEGTMAEDITITFLALNEHETNYAVTEQLKAAFGQDVNVILIPEVTRGAVETVLAASESIQQDEELIITDSDHFFDGRVLALRIANKGSKTVGIIPVFAPSDTDPKWSYSLLDSSGRIVAEGEKDPKLAAQGAHANIGCYYFSTGNVFLDEANAMITENDRTGAPGKEEFYISQVYKRLLEKRGEVLEGAIVDTMWGLGTPNDLEYFLGNYPSN